ncbi:hypothetical protein LXL04_025902 [Taraxacum kok-saghyz]
MRGEEERWHRRVNGARAQRDDDTVGVWVQKDERLRGTRTRSDRCDKVVLICSSPQLLYGMRLVTKLCDLGIDKTVCSVSWSQQGTTLAVGTSNGEVQIWDVFGCKKLRSMEDFLNLFDLEVLLLNNNGFTGAIPTEVAYLSNPLLCHLNAEISEFNESREKELPLIQEVDIKIKELRQMISALNNQQMSLKAAFRKKKDAVKEMDEKISSAEFALVQSAQENASLRSKIVQSPVKLQRALEEKKAVLIESKNAERESMQSFQIINFVISRAYRVTDKQVHRVLFMGFLKMDRRLRQLVETEKVNIRMRY